jgi:hypothetical protein
MGPSKRKGDELNRGGCRQKKRLEEALLADETVQIVLHQSALAEYLAHGERASI